ncbi:sensor histidine kinase [Eubacteriales bacterium OttesenSCG-928-K08]|nr:sensor histidine kinase [Eubacteriales bacterium OttesenSCG-928-K08]
MIRKYISYRKPLFFFTLLVSVLSCSFWWLNDAPTQDILYSLLLMIAALILITVPDCFLFILRYKELNLLKQNIARFEQEVPEGNNAIEQTYAKIAIGLLERLRNDTDKLDHMHRRDVEYYTMWMHQIKTPLFALRLLIENGSATDAQLSHELFEIERYVEMALSYARATRLENDIVITYCNVEEILRKSIRKYAPQFISKNLRVEIEGGDLYAHTDEKWLAFILEQLLSNAAKYTHSGGLTARMLEGALVLEDTGIGILPQDLPRVFERGFTGFNGRVDQRASGLGLSMARRVAKALNISIQLESEYGKGTKVILRLPQDGLMFE